jgi:hypothetical protein
LLRSTKIIRKMQRSPRIHATCLFLIGAIPLYEKLLLQYASYCHDYEYEKACIEEVKKMRHWDVLTTHFFSWSVDYGQ